MSATMIDIFVRLGSAAIGGNVAALLILVVVSDKLCHRAAYLLTLLIMVGALFPVYFQFGSEATAFIAIVESLITLLSFIQSQRKKTDQVIVPSIVF